MQRDEMTELELATHDLRADRRDELAAAARALGLTRSADVVNHINAGLDDGLPDLVEVELADEPQLADGTAEHELVELDVLASNPDRDRPWLHIGALVVIARPPRDCDVGGSWEVIGISYDRAHLKQGGYIFAAPFDWLEPESAAKESSC